MATLQRFTKLGGIPLLGALLVAAGLAIVISRGRSSSAEAQLAADDPRLVTRVYPCPGGDAEEIAARLRERYQGNDQVRIVADGSSRRIVVRAPASIQEEIARQGPPPAPSGPGQRGATPPPGPQQQNGQGGGPQVHEVALRNVTCSELESSLRTLLGSRLSPQPPSQAGVRRLSLDLSEGSTVELTLNHGTQVATVRGPESATGSALRLIEGLDVPRGAEGAATRVVPLRQASAASVRRAVEAIRAGSGGPLRVTPAAQLSQGPGPAPGQAAPGPAVQNAGEPDGGIPGVAPGGEAGLIGPVQIELLEGLDVMVIKGHRRDVDRVIEIINQIDQLSAVTEPAVRVYRLANVECQALAELIRPLYEQVYQPRQSAVSITPLVKPNGLLLIGRPEGVQTVVNLIRKLDVPVAPDTQFRVFFLRHASATTAQLTIDQFFLDREGEPRAGLGARVHVVADFRSNALLVQAGPRDMAEIAEMIAQLDTESGKAVNEVRVFQLRNALAEDLAEVLREAITVQQYGYGVGGIRPGQTGGAVAPTPGQAVPGRTGTTSQLGFEQKSAALRFITVDAQGKRLLRSGILTDVRISADVRANALVISAPSGSMGLLAALVERLDELPATEAQVKVFTILNGDAEGLLQMLQSLFGTQVGADQPASVLAGAVENESSLVPLRFAVDVRTNSIIASGSIGDLSVVEAILLRLDDADVRTRNTKVFKLKNAPASDVATAINDFLRSERQLEQIAPGLVSPFEQIEREVVVVPEPVTNSLIVSATPRFYDEIEEIIQKLDEQPPMVVIQVLIAEVALTDTEELGVEAGLQDIVLFDRSQLLADAAGNLVNSPGFNFNNQPLGNSDSNASLATRKTVGTQGLSHFGLGRTSAELGFGGFVFSASSGNVSVLIRALKQCGRLDVLARPQIMTLDNQSAQVQVGQTVSRVTGTIVSSNVQNTTVEDEPTGLILLVTPRINDDGLVVMNISATNSQLGAESEGTPVSISVSGEVLRSPPINIITAETTIAALSGQTVVLGGLITKERDVVERKVPVLGDIPLLGWLARYETEQIRRTELLIIMTPHVVRSREDAERIKQVEAARMHWCLADVLKLIDDPLLLGGSEQFTGSGTAVIYPDLNPTGEVPGSSETGFPPHTLPEEPPIAPEAGAPRLPVPSPEPSRLPVEVVEPPAEPPAQPPPPSPSQGTQLRFRRADSVAYRPAPAADGWPGVQAAVHYTRQALGNAPPAGHNGAVPSAYGPPAQQPPAYQPSAYSPPAGQQPWAQQASPYQQPGASRPAEAQAAYNYSEQPIESTLAPLCAEPYGRQPGVENPVPPPPADYRPSNPNVPRYPDAARRGP